MTCSLRFKKLICHGQINGTICIQDNHMNSSIRFICSLYIISSISSFVQTRTSSTSEVVLLASELRSTVLERTSKFQPHYWSAITSPRWKLGRSLTVENKKNMWDGIELRAGYTAFRLLTVEEEQTAGAITHRSVQLKEIKRIVESATNTSLCLASWAAACNYSVEDLTVSLKMAKIAQLQLVQHNVRLVDYWVRYLLQNSARVKHVSYYELVVQGVLGLSKAAERYDGRSNCRFATFAQPFVMQELFKGLTTLQPGCFLTPRTLMLNHRAQLTRRRLRGVLGRQPSDQEVAQAVGITVKRMKEFQRDVATKSTFASAFTYLAKNSKGGTDEKGDGNTVTYLDLAMSTGEQTAVSDSGQLRHLMWRAGLFRLMNDHLTAREMRTVVLRFGLDDSLTTTIAVAATEAGDSLSITRVAQLMGISTQGVYKILKRALYKLRSSESIKDVLQQHCHSMLPAEIFYQTSGAYVSAY